MNVFEITSPAEFIELIKNTDDFEKLVKITEELKDKAFIKQKDGTFVKVLDFDIYDERKNYIHSINNEIFNNNGVTKKYDWNEETKSRAYRKTNAGIISLFDEKERKEYIERFKEKVMQDIRKRIILPYQVQQQNGATRSLEEMLNVVQKWVDWLNSAYEEEPFGESKNDREYLVLVSAIKGRLNVINYIYKKNFNLAIGSRETNIEDDCAYAYIKINDGVMSERELEIDRWGLHLMMK